VSTRRRVITEPDGTKDTAGTLDGKRALVTGGTRGMGAAIARLLAGRNARVLVTARHPAADCAARLIQADLAAPEGADLVAGEAIRVLGGLDIVAHCVGSPFAKPGGALALTDEDWMDALNTNLLAAVRLDRAVLPAMIRQRSGVIVHVSSLQWNARTSHHPPTDRPRRPCGATARSSQPRLARPARRLPRLRRRVLPHRSRIHHRRRQQPSYLNPAACRDGRAEHLDVGASGGVLLQMLITQTMRRCSVAGRHIGGVVFIAHDVASRPEPV